MGIRIEGQTEETGDELEHDEQTGSASEQHAAETEDDEDQGEALVTIGEPPEDASASSEDEQHQPAPQWAKDLRKDYRRVQRELADERRKNSAVQNAAHIPESDVLGAPPTLEGCGWDEAEFRKQTAEHVRKEAAIEARKTAQADAVRQQQAEAARVHTAYRAGAKALKVSDFDEAEDAVVGSLSEIQQNIILDGTDNPALVVYALGKNPAEVAKLAKLTNPVKFAVAVGKLEKDIKVTPRNHSSKPAPEAVPRGSSASLSGGGNTALDAARKRAEQTGDYTEVNRIRRAQRAAGRK